MSDPDTTGRPRDRTGRPLNPRPRDGAGRPLPFGAQGVERVDEDLVLPPAESLAEAQRLLDAGFPFHAHEVLEGAWKSAPGEERSLWKGLAQLAVGLTHLQRGNRRGAVALLRRGAANVADGAEAAARHDLDAARITDWGERRAAAVELGGTDAGEALVLR